MSVRLVVFGDSLLDRDIEGDVARIAPDAPVPVVDQRTESARPGGAALCAALAAADGCETMLVTALGDDRAGVELAALVAAAGVQLVDLRSDGPTAEKVRIRSQGRSLVRLDRGGRGGSPVDDPPTSAAEATATADAILVSDYGRGMTRRERVRDLIEARCRSHPVVWDPHPRGTQPVAGTRLVTPNAGEAAVFVPDVDGEGIDAATRRAVTLRGRWAAAAVALTMGDVGALLVDGAAHPFVVTPPHVTNGDPCGAGDRFAVTATRELAKGSVPSEAVQRAVAEAGSFVARGGASALNGDAALRGSPADEAGDRPAADVAAEVRRAGGTVVAAGGCFDIVHPGHIAMLEAAHRLGDCLIVCLNSDRSVRALKGRGRPVNRCEDRAAVLAALSCVDAVEVFDETEPSQALRRLRPHLWAKGGDYGASPLPESRVLSDWGGQVVILPYLQGHSTTSILGTAARHG